MIITFLRSSSYGSHSNCPFDYFLNYTLGLPKRMLKPAADFGSMTHKALELLARKKLAEQQQLSSFAEDEIGKTWNCSDFDVHVAYDESFEYYSKKVCPQWDWSQQTYDQCKAWLTDIITMHNGRWNPLNCNVVQPEQYFDFTIDKPWARYRYQLQDGTILEGQLGLKGTVDLLIKNDEDTYELRDWKTGSRKDFSTGKTKGWKELRKDPQLRMYHYALSRLYPNIKYFIITILFVKDGGPFSLDFGPEDLKLTEDMLQKKFETIRDCQRPYRIMSDPANNYKCKYLCSYYRDKQPGTNTSVCDFMHQQVLQLGVDRVTAKYGDMKRIGAYGEGGGRKAK